MIYDNLITLSLIAGMLLMILTSNSFKKRINLLFLSYTILVLFLLIADMVDYYLKDLEVLNTARYISSAVGYTLRPALLAIIISILLRHKKNYIVLWIPVAIQAIIAFTSKYTHLMFWFDVNNGFHRGPLGFMAHILSGCYMMMLIIMTIRTYYNLEISEILTVVFCAIICTGATIIESVVKIKFMLPGAMMVSISVYYLSLYTQIYKRDTLTGVMNRRSFFLDAKKWAAKQMGIISMDLNGLKEINDIQGHAAGDIALKTLCEESKKAAGKQFRLYRTGGDEFMIIGVNMSESETQDCIGRIKKALGRTSYMASLGYAMYKADDVFDEVCQAADMRMYENKRMYKHR